VRERRENGERERVCKAGQLGEQGSFFLSFSGEGVICVESLHIPQDSTDLEEPPHSAY
jgi:hypothetical protein